MNVKLNISEAKINSDTSATLTVSYGDTAAHLYGEVGFIADYVNFALLKPNISYVEEILREFCKSDHLPSAINMLTEIVGEYLLILVQKDRIYIYKSDEVSFVVYYAKTDNSILISTQFLEIVEMMPDIRLSQEDFNNFLRIGETTASNATLIDGIKLMLPYSLYTINNQTLDIVAHSFPGLHTITQNHHYTEDDYFTAIGAYKPHFPSFTIAYSGGADSRIIADLYRDKVSEISTLIFKEPYLHLSRQAESEMADKAARHWNVPHTNVLVNYANTQETQKYQEHYVSCLPYSCFPPSHFYELVKMAKSPVILHGQAADNMWDWGNHQLFLTRQRQTSSSGRTVTAVFRSAISRMFKSIHVRSNMKSSSKLLLSTFAARYAMVNSFDKLVYPWALNIRRTFGPTFDNMRTYPYKMFTLARYLDYCGRGETLSWAMAGKYFNKRVIGTYLSPIALHVNSHIKRTNFLDAKAPFRSYLAELQPYLPTAEEIEQYPHTHWLASPTFDIEEDFDWQYDFLDYDVQQKLTYLTQNQPKRITQKNYFPPKYRLTLKHLKILFDSLEELQTK